jgi:alkylated DNA repair dioxygenase AlkB
VRSDGASVRGLATWSPNEAGVGVYRPGSIGVTAHMDGRWYRRLVAVFTLVGVARFEIRAAREGEPVETWDARAGGVVFLRGPGLAGARDGRPYHVVQGPKRGVRCSLALRMAVRSPTA